MQISDVPQELEDIKQEIATLKECINTQQILYKHIGSDVAYILRKLREIKALGDHGRD